MKWEMWGVVLTWHSYSPESTNSTGFTLSRHSSTLLTLRLRSRSGTISRKCESQIATIFWGNEKDHLH